MDLKRLKKQLKSDEGYRSNVYEDTLGKSTIGYGHRVLSTDDMPIYSDGGFDGKEIAKEAKITFDKLLDKDMAIAIADAKSLIGEDHPPEILEGFSNMAFQLGKTKLSKFKKTIEFINNNNYMEASIEILDSNWAKQTYNRANRISTLFQKAKKIYDPRDNHANAIDKTHPDYDKRLDGLGLDEMNNQYRTEIV